MKINNGLLSIYFKIYSICKTLINISKYNNIVIFIIPLFCMRLFLLRYFKNPVHYFLVGGTFILEALFFIFFFKKKIFLEISLSVINLLIMVYLYPYYLNK